jgi:ATP-dependent DNA helicase RecQ
VGTELDRRGWLSVYRQLVAQGVVLPDIAGHGGLSLAPRAAEILRGARTVSFRVEERGRERQKARSDRKAATNAAELDPVARALWEALRAWRLEEARRQDLPPYVIFHDSTLTEVARRRPGSLAALAEIPGVGRSKLERYGEVVIGVVAESMARDRVGAAGARPATDSSDDPPHDDTPARG